MSVTVVIPCLDGEAYLGETLRAVQGQWRQPAEVIVVDDGSRDGSVAVAEAAGARVLRTAGRQGPGVARNVGVEAARTPFVAFVDADDTWTPDHLERLVGLLERHPAAALAWSRIETFGTRRPGRAPVRQLAALVPCPPEVPFDALPLLVGRNIVAQSTAVARRDAILAAGGYDPTLRFSEDYDLWTRLAAAGHPFVYLPQVTCRYRVHATQLTAIDAADAAVAETSWRVRQRLHQLLSPERRATLVPPLEERLRALYEAELRQAWRAADREWIAVLLAGSERVPGGAAIAEGWRARGVLLPFWVPVHRTLRLVRVTLRRLGADPVAASRSRVGAVGEAPAESAP